MKGIIYKATNKKNGKVYVGQTTNTLERRKRGHKDRAKNTNYNSHFHNAIRKYGFDVFKWEIIGESYDIDMLNESISAEIFYTFAKKEIEKIEKEV